MEDYFREGLRQSLLASVPIEGKKLLLMLSGGADSMVLLHFLMELKDGLGFELGAFSLDHMFRGEASLEDLNFVRAEAEKRKIRLHAYRRDVGARARELGMGDEISARMTRYTLAEALRLCYGYDYIVSAHHRSDAVESIFLHFIRGSGLGGLRGIRAVDGPVLRPLLFASKEDILKAAKDLNIPYREDETNNENSYSRNYLRNEVMPRLERLNPKLENALMRAAALLSDEDDFMEDMAALRLKELAKKEGLEGKVGLKRDYELALDLQGLRATHPALKRRLLLKILRERLGRVDVYSSVVEELMKLTQAPSGKKIEFRGLLFEIERDVLIIRVKRELDPTAKLVLGYGPHRIRDIHIFCEKAALKEGRIYLEDGRVLGPPLSSGGEAKLLDYLVLPKEVFEKGLIIREREAEDVMRPKRLKGRARKIKKLLNDYKIPAHKREGLIYLASEFEVLWILGIEKTFVHSQLLAQSEENKNIVLIRAYAL